jgi:hypothetical protein
MFDIFVFYSNYRCLKGDAGGLLREENNVLLSSSTRVLIKRVQRWWWWGPSLGPRGFYTASTPEP